MKHKIHLSIGDYEFVETDFEGTLEELLAFKETLTNALKDNSGLSIKDWAQARNKMLLTGEFDPNLQLSKAQRYWVNETKNALRAIKNNE